MKKNKLSRLALLGVTSLALVGIDAQLQAGSSNQSNPNKQNQNSSDQSMADQSCKGKNDCKGQGMCKTDKHSCKGKNDCKGQGGGPGMMNKLLANNMANKRSSVL